MHRRVVIVLCVLGWILITSVVFAQAPRLYLGFATPNFQRDNYRLKNDGMFSELSGEVDWESWGVSRLERLYCPEYLIDARDMGWASHLTKGTLLYCTYWHDGEQREIVIVGNTFIANAMVKFRAQLICGNQKAQTFYYLTWRQVFPYRCIDQYNYATYFDVGRG